ncbi:MAG: hypothetical protein ACI8R0_001891 [Alteromonadales bacterium]|jgi:hypothetical protein|tara:strand:- start:1596 stop:1856 length:261 start_codon:yes stop_codon:yes gene_type:complete
MQTSGGRMSNDLLFPILPRNTKVPIETDDRVKKVQKTKKSEHFSEEERDQFQDVKRTEIIEKSAENSKDKERGNSEGGLKHIDIDV